MPKTLDSGPVKEQVSKDNEVFPLVNGLRDFAQQYYRGGPFTLATGALGIGTIYTSEDVPEGGLWSVRLMAQAIGVGTRCYFDAQALFFRDSGGATTQLGGTTAVVTLRTDANLTVLFAISGNKVTARVSDASGRTLSWTAWVEIRVSR